MSKSIETFSPLTEASFYILLSLVNPLHGYGVIKKVETMSFGRVKLAAGTLYGSISNLLRNKLIVSVGDDISNKRRKLYQATSLGIELIKYELKRLSEMLDNGKNELGDFNENN